MLAFDDDDVMSAGGSTSAGGLELRVGNKYRLGRKIGSGSFGDIYLGAMTMTMAMKEKKTTDDGKPHRANDDARREAREAGRERRGERTDETFCVRRVGTHIKTNEEVGIKLVGLGDVCVVSCRAVSCRVQCVERKGEGSRSAGEAVD